MSNIYKVKCTNCPNLNCDVDVQCVNKIPKQDEYFVLYESLVKCVICMNPYPVVYYSSCPILNREIGNNNLTIIEKLIEIQDENIY